MSKQKNTNCDLYFGINTEKERVDYTWDGIELNLARCYSFQKMWHLCWGLSHVQEHIIDRETGRNTPAEKPMYAKVASYPVVWEIGRIVNGRLKLMSEVKRDLCAPSQGGRSHIVQIKWLLYFTHCGLRALKGAVLSLI